MTPKKRHQKEEQTNDSIQKIIGLIWKETRSECEEVDWGNQAVESREASREKTDTSRIRTNARKSESLGLHSLPDKKTRA
jgi:hypothetical protein